MVWDVGGEFRTVHAPGRLLESFVELADAPVKRILDYARRWGVFEVCEHDLPASHNPPPVPIPIDLRPRDKLPWCHARGFWGARPWEGIEIWRGYSRKFRALLDLAARLHEGKVGEPDDWRRLNVAVEDDRGRSGRVLEQDQVQLAVVLNQFISQARVGITVEWDRATPVVAMTGRGLFSALVTQLVLATARSDGLAICSGCAESYAPRRRPRGGQRRYCEKCRERKVPQRDAARDYYRRQGLKASAPT